MAAERAAIEARIKRHEAREAEKNRQQTWVRLKDDKLGEYNEVVPTRYFQTRTIKDRDGIKMRSERAGHEYRKVVSFGEAPPKREKRKNY